MSASNKKRSKPSDDTPMKAAAGAAAAAAAGAAAAPADAKADAAAAVGAAKVEGREKQKLSRKSKDADAGKAASADTKKDELEDLQFEDDFEDQYDSEDERLTEQIAQMKLKGEKIGDERDSDEEVEAGVARADELKRTGALPPKKPAGTAADGKAAMSDDAGAAEEDDEDDDDDDSSKRVPQTQVWRPADGIGEDEKLEYDPKFYSCYHALKADWPCLSFDVMRDKMGELRTKYPLAMYMVTGTQAAQGAANKILVMKISNIQRTKGDGSDDDDDDDEEEDDDATDDDPTLGVQTIDCDGEVNRIRAMPQQSNFVASWHSTGHVHVWNTIEQLRALDSNGPAANKKIPTKPVFSFAHTFEEKVSARGRGGAGATRTVKKPVEGFALDWSMVAPGRLASGDHKAGLYLWDYKESSWVVDGNGFKGHTASIEDIQWSPNEANVFATCSSDKTIRIWDTRQAQRQSIRWVVAHKSDVNVISWNRKTPAFLVSGSDDASIKIWDFRKFTSNSALAHFKFHTQPITSVEWHPHEDSVFAAASADNSISVWDLALERDADFKGEGAAIDEKEYPPQLYFVHRGQTDIKEVHFHPQVPALMLSTAADGFNVFKPANMELTPQQLTALSQPYKAPAAGAAGAAATAGGPADAAASAGAAGAAGAATPNKPTA